MKNICLKCTHPLCPYGKGIPCRDEIEEVISPEPWPKTDWESVLLFGSLNKSEIKLSNPREHETAKIQDPKPAQTTDMRSVQGGYHRP